jgi:metallo-beta-lactamase class B
MKNILRAMLVLLALPAAAAAQGNPDWHAQFPAFKIAGNLYYVGTADLAVYLIRTPQGNILINSGLRRGRADGAQEHRAAWLQIQRHEDRLISHAHGDHDEGVGQIQKDTGARVMVMDGDVADVQSTAQGRPGAKVDRTLHDGDKVELGGSTLVAHLTPGHTKGCTTWTMQVEEGGKKLNAVIIGSPNVNAGYILVATRTTRQSRRTTRRPSRCSRACPSISS